MTWKEFWLRLAHDYKPLVGAFLFGWHMKQPVWIRWFRWFRRKEDVASQKPSQ